jgi:hypothetical protein
LGFALVFLWFLSFRLSSSFFYICFLFFFFNRRKARRDIPERSGGQKENERERKIEAKKRISEREEWEIGKKRKCEEEEDERERV